MLMASSRISYSKLSSTLKETWSGWAGSAFSFERVIALALTRPGSCVRPTERSGQTAMRRPGLTPGAAGSLEPCCRDRGLGKGAAPEPSSATRWRPPRARFPTCSTELSALMPDTWDTANPCPLNGQLGTGAGCPAAVTTYPEQ